MPAWYYECLVADSLNDLGCILISDVLVTDMVDAKAVLTVVSPCLLVLEVVMVLLLEEQGEEEYAQQQHQQPPAGGASVQHASGWVLFKGRGRSA